MKGVGLSFWYSNRIHHGVVLDASNDGFDRGSACYGSIFTSADDPGKIYLYYTGAEDTEWSRASIGLAESDDGFNFRKISNQSLFEEHSQSFCRKEALSPAIVGLQNRLYMVFSGKPTATAARRIGIAHADDPKGPWHIVGELRKPTEFWEGNAIDNGLSVVKLDDESILVYYSNVTSARAFDIPALVRRYPIRRIGILKVRIHRAALSGIEASRFSGNPLRHLNGPKGSWNESVFSPGYIQLNGMGYLLPAASTYSVGFPFKQYIGAVVSNSPYFPEEKSQLVKLIDGPSEKTQIIPNIKSEIALDTPSPKFDAEKRKLFLYYSVADRADKKWKIALTTFDLAAAS